MVLWLTHVDARSQWAIGTFVGGFAGGLDFARASDLLAAVPERHTGHSEKWNAQFSSSRSLAGKHRFNAMAPADGW